MAGLTELGPFVSKITKYIDIDVEGYKTPDSIGFIIPDVADNFLHEVGAIEVDITSNGGEVQIEWTLQLTLKDGGVELWDLSINRVWGTLKFWVNILDPTSDDDQEVEHEMEFSTVGKLVNNSLVPGDWTMESRYETLSLSGGIAPLEVEINVEDKKITVVFE